MPIVLEPRVYGMRQPITPYENTLELFYALKLGSDSGVKIPISQAKGR